MHENILSIFHTYALFRDKASKLVIDGGSAMNVVSKSTIARFDLKPKSRPHPFKVAWVDKISLPIKERCLVTLKLGPCSEAFTIMFTHMCHTYLVRTSMTI